MEKVHTIFKSHWVIKKLALLFMLCGASLQAQSIFTNPITATDPSTANPYTNGQTVNGSITVSGIGRGTGIAASSASNRYSASGWNSGALNLNDYFEFILTPNLGCKIDFTSFGYVGQASGTGPINCELRSSADGFVSAIGSALITGATINLAAASYQNIAGAITFRLYGWGASSGTGTWSINDFTFNGTVTCGTPNTISTGSVSGAAFALTDCTITASGAVDFTSSGTFNVSNIYTAQLSDPFGSFAMPTSIGVLSSTANFGSISITIPAGTASGTGYMVRVVSDDPNTIGSNSPVFAITLTCIPPAGSCLINGAMGPNYTFGCGSPPNKCNLASVYSGFGTFCGNSVIGCGTSCSATNVSSTYNLESGCTVTITAEFKERIIAGSDCSSGAMDGTDKLYITNVGGIVVSQTSTMVVVSTCGAYPTSGTYTNSVSNLPVGCGNSGGTVQMIITGGAFTVGGAMNRGDEIVTYTVSASGSCSVCPVLLPVGFIDFYATKNDEKNDVFWKVMNEDNIKKYIIEKSEDGIIFKELSSKMPLGITSNQVNYYAEDLDPSAGITYYRLATIEGHSAVKYHKTISLDRTSKNWQAQFYQQDNVLYLEFKNSIPKNSEVMLFDLSGKLMAETIIKDSQTKINLQNFSDGIYFVSISTPYKTENFKIIIQK